MNNEVTAIQWLLCYRLLHATLYIHSSPSEIWDIEKIVIKFRATKKINICQTFKTIENIYKYSSTYSLFYNLYEFCEKWKIETVILIECESLSY